LGQNLLDSTIQFTKQVWLTIQHGLPVKTERSVVGRHIARGVDVCLLKLVFCHSLNVTAGRLTSKLLKLKSFCLFASMTIPILMTVCYIVKSCRVRHSFTGTMSLYHNLGFGNLLTCVGAASFILKIF